MQKILAEQALLANGWASDVMVEVNTRGQIDRVLDAVSEAEQKTATHRVGIYCRLRSMCSHAFQRAMAGLTECRGPDPPGYILDLAGTHVPISGPTRSTAG